MIKIAQTLVLYTMLILAILPAKAQVTIGSNIAPASGTLLDLKQRESTASDGTTANKGLGLPRVLMSTTTPDSGSLAASIGGVGDWDETEHVGLIVYNVKPLVLDPLTCKMVGPAIGLHVWDGNKWDVLNAASEIDESEANAGDTGTVTGISGIVYKTRIFGDAGEWMIENLRETTYDTPETGTIIEDRNLSNSPTLKSYYYPANHLVADGQHTGNIDHDKSLYIRNPIYGLLYTWAGASNGQSTDNFTSGAGATPSTVQGICPEGWRLPSDKDWNDLEKEIANRPELYSDNVAGSTKWISAAGQGGNPNTDWASITGWRSTSKSIGHGQSMKKCAVVEGVSVITGGRSTNSGFSVLLLGSSNRGLVSNYGTNGYFWSSSMNSSNVRYRFLGNENAGVVRNATGPSGLFSVRCKRQIE